LAAVNSSGPLSGSIAVLAAAARNGSGHNSGVSPLADSRIDIDEGSIEIE
jgi:hypothetical protein